MFLYHFLHILNFHLKKNTIFIKILFQYHILPYFCFILLLTRCRIIVAKSLYLLMSFNRISHHRARGDIILWLVFYILSINKSLRITFIPFLNNIIFDITILYQDSSSLIPPKYHSQFNEKIHDELLLFHINHEN